MSTFIEWTLEEEEENVYAKLCMPLKQILTKIYGHP